MRKRISDIKATAIRGNRIGKRQYISIWKFHETIQLLIAMKKVLVLTLCICLLTSCEAAVNVVEEPIIEPTPIIEEENSSLIDEVTENVKIDGDTMCLSDEIAIHVKRRTLVDFDAVYHIYVGYDRSLLDAGYILYFKGDYFHHNTRDFLNLFWLCKAGMKVKINGVTYTSGGIYHGVIRNNKI